MLINGKKVFLNYLYIIKYMLFYLDEFQTLIYAAKKNEDYLDPF